MGLFNRLRGRPSAPAKANVKPVRIRAGNTTGGNAVYREGNGFVTNGGTPAYSIAGTPLFSTSKAYANQMAAKVSRVSKNNTAPAPKRNNNSNSASKRVANAQAAARKIAINKAAQQRATNTAANNAARRKISNETARARASVKAITNAQLKRAAISRERRWFWQNPKNFNERQKRRLANLGYVG